MCIRDSMISLRARYAEELKEREEELGEKEAMLRDRQEQQRIEAESIGIDKKKLEELENLYEDKKTSMQQQINEQKDLYGYFKNSLEEQYKGQFNEVARMKEEIAMGKKKLESDREQLGKAIKRCKLIEKQILLESEKKQKFGMKKDDLDEQIDEDIKQLNSKIIALSTRKEEIEAQKAKLSRRKANFKEKLLQMKREKDELKLNVQKYHYDSQELEIEKQRIKKLAREVKEQSSRLYEFKVAIEKTRQQLEVAHVNADCKNLLTEIKKRKIKDEHKEVLRKERALENMQLEEVKQKYLYAPKSKPFLSKTPIKDNIARAEKPFKVSKSEKAPRKSLVETFKADDFIQKLERNFGNPQSFMKYIANERVNLLRSTDDYYSRIEKS
eukprot:TRINITY_DN2179_c0_g3_i5.p1 TRINITY_DN2179_c0_g3~~TRINITY_DN2179_c0_g3_i5.p1  ORF type:complete len:385 (+),score=115.79 TRINITY_DN2179_c0_g3_i5:83-1237(+)